MIIFRIIHLLILIAFLCTGISLPVSYAQKTREEKLEEYFQKGIELREKGDIEGAIKAFLYVTARDHGNADVYYELGKTYIKKPTFRNFKKAEEALWKARRITRGTRELHALGDLYDMRDFEMTARIMFKWIVKEDTTDVRALTILSDYYYERGLNEDWDKRYDINDYLLFDGKSVRHIFEEGEQSLPLRKMNKYVKKGVEMNERILAVEPDNPTVLHRKAVGYLEMNDFYSFIDFFKGQLEKDREDYNVHLFLGLGYGELSEHEIARAHYDRALELMDPDERISFENLYYLKPDFNISLLGSIEPFNPEKSEIFWKINDPLFVTSYNERRSEHYGRIAEANLRFSEPSEGIDGWKTIRGYLWIRFGKPLQIKKSWETLNSVCQKWIYEDFTFELLGSFIESKRKWGIRKSRRREVIPSYWVKPDYYRFKPTGKLYDLTMDLVCFKGNDGYTDVNIFYEIPIDKITWKIDPDALSGKVKHGVFAFYKNIDWMYQAVDTTYFSLDPEALHEKPLKSLVLSDSFEAPPIYFTIGVETSDEETGSIGTNRVLSKVYNFGTADTLMMSGILVANKASIIDLDKKPSKKNISFAANPSHNFGTGKPINIYFEIYNLYIEDERAQNHYRMEYTIKPEPKKESAVKRFLKNLVWLSSKDEGISVSNEYRGVGKNDFQLLTIEHSITKPGEYRLSVRITDLIRRMTTERSTPIWIY